MSVQQYITQSENFVQILGGRWCKIQKKSEWKKQESLAILTYIKMFLKSRSLECLGLQELAGLLLRVCSELLGYNLALIFVVFF